jgi:hypothetical protein
MTETQAPAAAQIVTDAWAIRDKLRDTSFVPQPADFTTLKLGRKAAAELYGEYSIPAAEIDLGLRKAVARLRTVQGKQTRQLTTAIRATGLVNPMVHLQVRAVAGGYTVQLPHHLAADLAGDTGLRWLARAYGAPVAVTGSRRGSRWTTLTVTLQSAA